ncbi:MAG TPA: PKD domain-containing protein [Patescibacteria group bacterium]|nr:PKD domain-containing protein [Patescibacteria group bacterium]
MKKMFCAIMVFLLGFVLYGDGIVITNSGQIFVGSEVHFRFDPDPGAAAGYRWEYGDGRSDSTTDNQSSHAFNEPGNYRVTCIFLGSVDAPLTGEIALTVNDNRSISPQGNNFRSGRRVNFQSENFVDNNLRWDFGDRTIESGPRNHGHVYPNPGNFTVRAFDLGGSSPTAITCQVVIEADNRQVTVSDPPELFQGAEVVFESRNFNSAQLKWDFGDGTVEGGGARQTHRYQRSGNFFLKVVEAGEPNALPVEKKIQVLNDNRDLAVKTGMIFADSEFEIEALYFRGSAVRWDFGDGQAVTGPRLMKHRYNRTGQFRIRAVDFAGRGGKFIEKIVMVENDSRFINLPGEIIAGEAIDMQLKNSAAGNFIWKFSDGDTRSGQDLKGKTFRHVGPQKITVTDAAGKYPPLEKTIRVLPDMRVLKSSARFTLPKEEVAFTAMNFKGPGIRWDFGDGTIKENGQAKETHQYGAMGRFQVKAVDFNGRSSKVFSTDVVVAEMTPGFKIDTLEFVFANGKYYRVIAKNSPGPNYQLRVKTKGRGVLSGQFILDNMPIGLFQIIVQENQTGQLPKSQMVALPALDPGLHELTVKFNNYTFNKRIPVIKYFVSTAGMIQITAPPIDSKVSLEDKIELRWTIESKNPLFEIAISAIPFQFMNDKQIEWQPVAGNSFTFIPDSFKAGSWIYWQVRLLNVNKQVQTTSEIASFKLSE